jgi:hypothetical protein
LSAKKSAFKRNEDLLAAPCIRLVNAKAGVHHEGAMPLEGKRSKNNDMRLKPKVWTKKNGLPRKPV